MRVTHLVKTAEGARWAARQIGVLTKLGISVDVVLPKVGANLAYFTAAGANTFFLETDIARLGGPRAFLEARRRFRDFIDERMPDLIHSHFVGTTMFARLALGRNHATPRIFQVPGPLHLETFLTRRVEIATAGRLDYWLGSCQRTADVYAREGIPADRIGLSYYGTSQIDAEPATPATLRALLNLNSTDRRKIVGMVAYAYSPKRWLGQKRGIKGHEDLIDAVRLLLDRGRDVHLVVLGGAWGGARDYFETIQQYGNERLGARVSFLGTRADVPSLYPGFDVAVHPSHSENVGGAGESLLMKIPTVATNVGGFPDVVRPGETGWLVPPRAPLALADAIDEVLADPAAAADKAIRGQALVRRLFAVERTGRETIDFYERVLGHSRSESATAHGAGL